MYRSPDGKLIVSATDLVGFLECGFLTELERALAAGKVKKPDVAEDPEVELLRRRGGEHEQRYIAELEADGRMITRLSETDSDGHSIPLETRAEKTLEAMRRGDDVIYQGTFFNGRWRGHPDFLLRVSATPGKQQPPVSRFADSNPPSHKTDSPSEGDSHGRTGSDTDGRTGSDTDGPAGSSQGLGFDWIYEVADTKLAHSTRASALIQICSYVEQLSALQEIQPEHIYVVLGGAQIKTEKFRPAEMMAYYRMAKTRFEAAVDDAAKGAPVYPIPESLGYPDPVSHCDVCRWRYAECKPTWYRDDSLTLVANITRSQREDLRELGVPTRRALATATVEPRYERPHLQAAIQVRSSDSGTLEWEFLQPEKDTQGVVVAERGLSALPEPSAGDLFFDIEGDPFAFNEGLEYLFGVWSGPQKVNLWESEPGAWQRFWAKNRDEEKKAFEDVMDMFMARWEQDPNMHIYHYAPYEPTALKRLAGRHATREEELDRLLRGRVFVDLYRVVRQGVRVGAEGYSIKDLEPLYKFDRTIDLRSAGRSIVEFEAWLETGRSDQALLDQIELYNKDDCVSAQLLRDWLEERRLEYASRFGDPLPRPPTEVDEVSENLSDRLIAVRELEERLTAPITKIAADQTDADRASWLVAHLLDWHRREDKSTWWRYYDLMSKTDDELFAEAEPIGLLDYVGIVEGGGTRQSDDHRYRFPPQEHKVEEDYDVDDPQLEGRKRRTGKVQRIDDVAGTIDIRRLKTWKGPHPRSIVQLNVIDAKAQREALMKLGSWVADNGIDSELPEWRAARDLLRRRPPRTRGGDGGALVRATETGTEAARRLAPSLDGTTLAIQGPPGSGKTYTGARMILDLVRAGRRVGLTSNSHKVVCNLLEAVLDAARDAGQTVRVIQKAKEDEALKDPSVKRVEANALVAEALLAGEVDVAAGTPWLWADEDLAGSIDTLFVDEAGQVSLANVVATSGAARNVVLLGDPQQLDQPTQGVHPEGAGVSALGHFLGSDETVPDDRGVFLEKTWRMHPLITHYTSDLFYEGRLEAVDGLERQKVQGDDWLAGSGLRWVPVEHLGNTNASPEEAARVVEIVQGLVGRTWVDADGKECPIAPEDILIVSPFNAHRVLIDRLLREAGVSGVPVGTVDKFQGQEAPVSIYTMATSRPEDAPRGMSFLYSLNRLNVATSRARALAIVVASPALLAAVPHSPDQLRMANGLCAFVDAHGN